MSTKIIMIKNDEEYWLQFRLKAIKDSMKSILANMVGDIICKFLETEKIDWNIGDAALKEIMENIEKWERQKVNK